MRGGKISRRRRTLRVHGAKQFALCCTRRSALQRIYPGSRTPAFGPTQDIRRLVSRRPQLGASTTFHIRSAEARSDQARHGSWNGLVSTSRGWHQALLARIARVDCMSNRRCETRETRLGQSDLSIPRSISNPRRPGFPRLPSQPPSSTFSTTQDARHSPLRSRARSGMTTIIGREAPPRPERQSGSAGRAGRSDLSPCPGVRNPSLARFAPFISRRVCSL
jgi:hypothetical protein